MNGVRLVLATSWLSRMRGLLGTQSSWGGGKCVLVLLPCSSIHTFGMRYALDIAFVNKKGVVLRSEPNVTPGQLLSCKGASFVLEKPHADDGKWPTTGNRIPILLHIPTRPC